MSHVFDNDYQSLKHDVPGVLSRDIRISTEARTGNPDGADLATVKSVSSFEQKLHIHAVETQHKERGVRVNVAISVPYLLELTAAYLRNLKAGLQSPDTERTCPLEMHALQLEVTADLIAQLQFSSDHNL